MPHCLASSPVAPAECSVEDSLAHHRGSPSWVECCKSWSRVAFHHVKKHMGVGIVCSVAYFDPGNWSVDLQAGSDYGYKLLFVVLLSGFMAMILQVMASKLGCVTGLDLATHCRMLLYNRPKHTLLYRWLLLYPLYILCEIAIISTDLAELLGSATALVLLFPRLPLWAGVLLTASDVLFILALGDSTRGRPLRLLEILIAVLVAAVFASLIVIIVRVTPNWADAFDGFLPSKKLFAPGGLYTSIGIIGATVMPHGLFLGSSLATQDRISSTDPIKPTASSPESFADMPLPSTTVPKSQRSLSSLWRAFLSTFCACCISSDSNPNGPPSPNCERGHTEWKNNSISFIEAHLRHGVVDIVMSLLGFAVIINSLILIIAGAVFFYGNNGSSTSPASLFEAHDLINTLVGKPAAILFALALLCAGQSASITATLAGQIVSEGFLRWRITPFLRRLITRAIGLIPSMIVAIVVGRKGINTLLVISQVVLSIVLPFVAFPLVWLTSSSSVMRVQRGEVSDVSRSTARGRSEGSNDITSVAASMEEITPDREYVDYSNGKIMMGLGYAIWLVVLVANVYVLVTLAMGNGD